MSTNVSRALIPWLFSAGNTADKPGYRPDIDGLRAFAVLTVVTFHFFPTLLPGGFIGVDIFFVISGYLISRILLTQLAQDRFSFLAFYAARVFRIFPALIVVLATCLAFGWFSLFPDEYAALGRHTAGGAGFVENFILLKEAGYFDIASELKPLMHLWSLAIEEQFYLLFPAFLWAAWRFRSDPRAVIITILALSFLLNVAGIKNNATKTFFSPQTRFWELMAGAWLAYLSLGKEFINPGQARTGWLNSITQHLSRNIHKWPISRDTRAYAGLATLAISAYLVPSGGTFPGWWALPPIAGALLLISAGPQASLNARLLTHGSVRFIGLISYPLYLWHWPVLAFIRIIESGQPAFTTRIAGAGVSILLAWITFEFIEKPTRFGSRSKACLTGLILAMLTVGSAGFVTSQQAGWENRAFIRSDYTQLKELRFYMPRDPGCDNRHPEFSTGYCYISGEGETKTVVLGDSHSNMLYWGLTHVMADSKGGVANFGHSACLPFLNVSVYQRGEADDCPAVINEAIRQVAKNPNIETVILSARGPLYLTGKGYGDLPTETRLDLTLRLADQADVKDRAEIFAIGMRNTLRTFRDHGKQVVFVLDVPELGFNPLSCVARPFRKAANTACRVSRAQYIERNQAYREIAQRVAREFPNTLVFDASASLCTGEWCNVIANNQMLYRDGDHPSLTGSIRMAEDLLTLLGKAQISRNPESLH